MARLMRSKSLNDIQFDNSNISAPLSARISSATAPPPIFVDDESSQAGCGSISDLHRLMYSACMEGDCIAAELLLAEDPNLCREEISEEGHRALHVAVSMSHVQLLQKLVESMSSSDLELRDGIGYTACCYAAISGVVEIAHLLMRKNPTLATLRDGDNLTPLLKAVLLENASIVSYFMRFVKVEDLSEQEWFNLLLLTIRLGAYGVALKILGMNEQVASMSYKRGTALHLLARQGIQKLGQSRAVELIKNPSILHDAAKVGNVELITMITHIYPILVWHGNDKGYSIFHIAVKHRQENVFLMINEVGTGKDTIAAWRDEKGNNILHLVGESTHSEKDIFGMPLFEMQREMLWYKKVVPCFTRGMRNNDGETAWELFLRRQSKLLEESRAWMGNVSGSCMVIATLLLSVVFASFFSVPGGFNENTGVPTLVKHAAFSICMMSGLVTALLAAMSIFCFMTVMMHSMNVWIIPYLFSLGLVALLFSVDFSITVLFSAVALISDRKAYRADIMYTVLSIGIISWFFCLTIYFASRIIPPTKLRKQTLHTLFKQPNAD